jgi:hypothetical protein
MFHEITEYEMIEDKLFEDCCNIADEYETNLLTVLDKYTSIEQSYKLQMIKVPYRTLIAETSEYFKDTLKDRE